MESNEMIFKGGGGGGEREILDIKATSKILGCTSKET